MLGQGIPTHVPPQGRGDRAVWVVGEREYPPPSPPQGRGDRTICVVGDRETTLDFSPEGGVARHRVVVENG